MDTHSMRELDYGIAMSAQSLIKALGMHWENQRRIKHGLSPAYDDAAFFSLITEHGIHHNAILDRWRNIQ